MHSHISLRDYALYMPQKRMGFSDRFGTSRKLGQLWVIDMYTMVIQQRLDGSRPHHTETLRTTKLVVLKILKG